MKISDSNKIKFVAAAFFLSGLSALMYQVIWMRKLTIIFGSTVFSVTTVITAFMFGLALGSFMAGRLIDKNKYNLFKFYGSLEIAIGAYCLLTPLMFSLVEILYGYVYGLSDLNFYLFSFVRFIVSFTILVVPTALMGATLPVLTKALVEGRQELGAKFGFLYSVNTFGAVTGTIITAFVMLPNLGLFLSLVAAVSLNILIGLFFYFMSSSFRDAGSMEAAKKKKTKEPSFLVSNKKLYNVLLLSFFVTGFAALGLEVAWFRILIMTIGNSVYAFATMLAVFLTGIARKSVV